MNELSQLLLEQLQHTLNDIADIIRPLREDGELKESPEEKRMAILELSWVIVVRLNKNSVSANVYSNCKQKMASNLL